MIKQMEAICIETTSAFLFECTLNVVDKCL